MEQKNLNSKYYNAIFKLLHKNNGVITYKQLKENNISSIYLTRMITKVFLLEELKAFIFLVMDITMNIIS
ncbi:type IV toxin-antitoxin system AbiEi family antitoxin domain-containing protein [Mycoplasmopsis bovis]|uniref:type IV toxin-antitoxin system AbiEi family antitoxin domain-containing protein n=1 Tax=Mycoplasmopsis bovis TaxID=28903 RepID=UPI003E134343